MTTKWADNPVLKLLLIYCPKPYMAEDSSPSILSILWQDLTKTERE